jgi:DNA-binding CsgD family transcriptional regulator
MSDSPSTSLHSMGSAPVEASVTWARVIIGRDGRRVVCLEVHRRDVQAAGCPELDDLLRQLAPHLVRAWRLGTVSRPAPAMSLRVLAPSSSRVDVASTDDLAGLPATARLRAEFGLTKAEARLALRLAAGSSLASAAQAFNVKLTTIRSQLQQIFAKTGASRQSELVAMLLSRGYGFPTTAMVSWPAHAA